MRLDIPAVQAQLKADRLDGWLLYDFHGLNPIAQTLTALTGQHVTRRWFYFIPATGAPQKLVHAIESGVLAHMPGETHVYAGREALADGLAALVGAARTVAMEYSPMGNVPYVSRVDAGTIEAVTRAGVAVVSSGDLVGRFEAAWDAHAVLLHREASARLYRVKDQAFAWIGARLSAGDAPDEYELQQTMLGWMQSEGLVTDAPPIVASGKHTANPHYSPTPAQSRRIGQGEPVLLDLWGKCDEPGAVYADITWEGYTGEPPADFRALFDLAIAGRDAAVRLVQSRIAGREPVCGWEVDRAARAIITERGHGAHFIHRTGHSLGEDVHGNGVHMDDFETHDDRRLLAGTGFTIEPGIYLADVGVRTEINMVVGPETAEVTGPRQQELVKIDVRM